MTPVELAARRIRRMFGRQQALGRRVARGEVSARAARAARERFGVELLQLLQQLAAQGPGERP